MGKKPRLIRWRALYKDGKFLDQYKNPYDEDIEDQNKYTDIDRKKLVGFQLYQGIKKKRILAHLNIEKGYKFFYRQRVWKNVFTNEETDRIHIIGWEKDLEDGKVDRIIVVVSNNGDSVMIYNDWKPDIQLDPINLAEFEKVECGE